MPALTAAQTKIVSLPAGQIITITGIGEWDFIALNDGGGQIDSGTYVNEDVIGVYAVTASVQITTALNSSLAYSVGLPVGPEVGVTPGDTGSISGGTTLTAATRYYHDKWVVNGGGNVPLAEDVASSGLTLAFEAGVNQPAFTLSFLGGVTVIQENGATLNSAEAEGGLVIVTCQSVAPVVWRVASGRYSPATLAADSAGRALVVQGGHVLQTARQAVRATTPILYRTSKGVAARAAGMQVGVGYGGKVVAVDNAGSFWRWTAAGGWEQVSTIGVITGTASVLFADSRGYLFYGVAATVGTPKPLWRSTDDGATWTSVLTFGGSNDGASPMCEDDAGNLYVGAYGLGASGVTLAENSRSVWKSTDSGANWTAITANLPGGAAAINRHIHSVQWDHHRSLLFVSTGDAGASSKINVSGDRGATFSAWAGSTQATALAFSATHVCYACDQSTDRRIYRAGVASLAEVLASTPAVAWDWVADASLPDNGQTTNGYAWQGLSDSQGNMVFPFGSEGVRTSVMASSDGGATWGEVLTGPLGQNTWHTFAQVSHYNTSRDGFQYGVDTTPTTDILSQWRVYAPGTVLPVAYSTSQVPSSGVVAPLTSLIDYGLQTPGVVQKLSTNYAAQATITMDGAVVDTAGLTLGAAVTTYPVYVDPFDNVTAPTMPTGWTLSTSGTGTAIVTTTAQKVSGANSAIAVLGAGAAAAQMRRTTAPWTLVDGATVWCSANWFVTAITATRCDFIEFNHIRIGWVLSDGVKRLVVANSALAINYPQALYEAIAFPENAWVKVKVAITVASNTVGAKNGRVRVLQDTGTGYKMALDVVGIPIYPAGSLSQNLWLGGNSGGNACSIYMDDVRMGTSDPDRPPAVVLTGSQQSVPRLGLYR